MWLLKKIFSVTNSEKHKVVCILGIKIKFELKNKNTNNKNPNTSLQVIVPEEQKDLHLYINGKNNIIDIDDSAVFFESSITINANNCHIIIKKIKYIRFADILVYNGDNQKIEIGNNTSIEEIKIRSCGEGSRLIIGNNCMLAGGISIWTADGHSIFKKDTKEIINAKKNSVIIGDNTWIAQDCKLLKNAKIAPNTIVGASSVITKQYSEEHTIIAGNPAIVIKKDVLWSRKDPYGYLNKGEK